MANGVGEYFEMDNQVSLDTSPDFSYKPGAICWKPDLEFSGRLIIARFLLVLGGSLAMIAGAYWACRPRRAPFLF